MTSPWLAAARPKTLFASVCPVALGAATAASQSAIPWLWLAATLACAVLLQITANYANDYWDYCKGADTHRRKGPVRMTASGRVSPQAMLLATGLALALALALGAALVWRGGWPIFFIGLVAAASAILYTAGPFPLAYLGLGEVFALLFFGPVAVLGTAYLLSLEWIPQAALLGLAPGGYAMALMAVNNLRDRKEDARAGKKTLAVRFGAPTAEALLHFSLWLPVAASGILLFLEPGWAVAPAGIVAVVIALRLSRKYRETLALGNLNLLIPSVALGSTIFTITMILSTWLLKK